MNNLTKDQLNELTAQVQERIDEFGNMAQYLPQMSPGVIRLVLDVLAEWQNSESQAARASDLELVREEDGCMVERPGYRVMTDFGGLTQTLVPETLTPDPEPVPVEEPVSAPINGNGHHQNVLSAQAVAALGPEHVVVNPVKEKRVGMRAADKRVLPNLSMLVKELQRQAMGNTMPTMAAFDMARPGNWATAKAHLVRLGLTWEQLAEEAGLKMNGVGRSRDE